MAGPCCGLVHAAGWSKQLPDGRRCAYRPCEPEAAGLARASEDSRFRGCLKPPPLSAVAGAGASIRNGWPKPPPLSAVARSPHGRHPWPRNGRRRNRPWPFGGIAHGMARVAAVCAGRVETAAPQWRACLDGCRVRDGLGSSLGRVKPVSFDPAPPWWQGTTRSTSTSPRSPLATPTPRRALTQDHPHTQAGGSLCPSTLVTHRGRPLHPAALPPLSLSPTLTERRPTPQRRAVTTGGPPTRPAPARLGLDSGGRGSAAGPCCQQAQARRATPTPGAACFIRCRASAVSKRKPPARDGV